MTWHDKGLREGVNLLGWRADSRGLPAFATAGLGLSGQSSLHKCCVLA